MRRRRFSRVFDITSSSAMPPSRADDQRRRGGNGGGILDQGGALTLKNDTLSNDQAIGVNPGDTAQGGGVDITDGGSLTVSGGTFQYDVAQGAAVPTAATMLSTAREATGPAARSSPTRGPI